MADRSAGGAAAAVTASPDARVGPGPDAWGDRISGRVTRGRVPGGVVYVAAWLVVFTVLTASQWAAGSYPVGTIVPLHAVLAAGVSFPIWLIGIFNRSAEEAMRRVRPLLAMSDAEATRLTERLTRMPARLEAAFAGFWIALTVLRVTLSPGSTVSLNLVFEGPAGVVGAAVMVVYIASVASYVVKIGHLGLGVYRLSQREVAVSLFELGPLNGFAVLTARIAASLVVMAVAIYASRQTLLTDPIGITAGLLALGFSGAIFVLPLLGIHERLA